MKDYELPNYFVRQCQTRNWTDIDIQCFGNCHGTWVKHSLVFPFNFYLIHDKHTDSTIFCWYSFFYTNSFENKLGVTFKSVYSYIYIYMCVRERERGRRRERGGRNWMSDWKYVNFIVFLASWLLSFLMQ